MAFINIMCFHFDNGSIFILVLSIARTNRLLSVVFRKYNNDSTHSFTCVSLMIDYFNILGGFESAPKGKSSTLMNIKCQHKTHSHTPFELLIIARAHTQTFTYSFHINVCLFCVCTF